MKKRSDRHKKNQRPTRRSRIQKNKHLYSDSPRIEVSSLDDLSDIFQDCDTNLKAKIISLDDLVKLTKEEKPEYDINKHLEKAKAKRGKSNEVEALEKQNEEYYNVLSNLNKKYVDSKTEELKNLVTEVKESVKEDKTLEETMLKALMDTHDYTKEDDTIEKEPGENTSTIEKIEPDTAEADKVYVEDGKFVNSFYTRSMDLSDKDFSTIDDKPRSKLAIFLIICIIIILIVIGGLFILNYL